MSHRANSSIGVTQRVLTTNCHGVYKDVTKHNCKNYPKMSHSSPCETAVSFLKFIQSNLKIYYYITSPDDMLNEVNLLIHLFDLGIQKKKRF